MMPAGLLLERKSRREWEETVADMRLLVRKKLKKDWFTHHESKIIVNLLVKTQGFEPEDSDYKQKRGGKRESKRQ